MSKRLLTLLSWKPMHHLTLKCGCRTISYSVQNYFKSKYSLDQIYPSSSLNIAKSPQMPQVENNKFSGLIPMEQLTITYSASTGPGGQNVNKVHTKVDMRFQVESAGWIPEDLKPRILDAYKNMVNKEGWLVLKSDRTSSQIYNVADCLDKLRFMIRAVEVEEPKPPSEDEITLRSRRHEKAARERLRVKRFQSDVKQNRGATDL